MSATVADGRRLRSERTRGAIVEAFLERVRATGEWPSSTELADRVGVTQRTLFHQFGDMDGVLEAAVTSQVARVLELIPRATDDQDVVARIDAFVDGLGAVLDEIAPVRWLVVQNATRSVHLRRGLATIRAEVRRRLAHVFGPVAAGLDDRSRREIVDAAEVATDPVTWRLLRTQLGLGRAAAAAVVRRTLHGLAGAG